MNKALQTIMIIATTVFLCAGCGEDAGISQKNLEPYEALICATDAEVVEAMGEGVAQDYPDTENQLESPVMWQREYKGCLFADGSAENQGKTVVRYYLPDLEDVISGAAKDDPRKVSCVIMSAALSTEDSVSLYEEVMKTLGDPTSEEAPFDKAQQYSGFWNGEKCAYQFWYTPPDNDGEQCGVVFAISDMEYYSNEESAEFQ